MKKVFSVISIFSLLVYNSTPFLYAIPYYTNVPNTYAEDSLTTDVVEVAESVEEDSLIEEEPDSEEPVGVEDTSEEIPVDENSEESQSESQSEAINTEDDGTDTTVVTVLPSEETPLEIGGIEEDVLKTPIEDNLTNEVNEETNPVVEDDLGTEDTLPVNVEETATLTEDEPVNSETGPVCADEHFVIVDSTTDDWDINKYYSSAVTKEPVKIGVKYIFPLEEDVSVTFKCLPEVSERSPLRIQKVKVSDLNLPDEYRTDAEYAYDINTEMPNGSFKYDLALPKPEGVDSRVITINESLEEIKTKGIKNIEIKYIDENSIDNENDKVVINNADHLSIKVPVYIITAVALQEDPITIVDRCMEDLYGKNLNCTANDVSIANVKNITFVDGDKCDSPSDTVKFTAEWEVKSTATQRYNVGLYFPTEGQTSALNGYCSITSLPNHPMPQWYDFDSNICGDISSAASVNPTITLEVKCLDPDSNNVLNLPYCTSWEQNASACNGPLDTIPGAPSKCNCNNGFEVPINVPYAANIEVIKVLEPTDDPGRFNLFVNDNKVENIGDGGTTGKVEVSAGTSEFPGDEHLVYETAYSTTNLEDYNSQITCVDRGLNTFDGGAALEIQGSGTLSVPVDKDDDVVCTITNNAKSGTLVVRKILINDNGGILDYPDFSFKVNGGEEIIFDDDGQIELTVPSGNYNIEETAIYGYTMTSDNCSNIYISNGGTETCVFTNDDLPGKLIVKKVVNNTYGGTLQASDFSFSINGGAQTPFETDGQNELFLNSGIYTVVESTYTGYQTTYDNCSNIKLANGETKTCTITNSDQPAKLIVNKSIINDNGGSKSCEDFTFTHDGNNYFSFNKSCSNELLLPAGIYSVSEKSDSGYAVTYKDCENIDLKIGGTATCNIVNDDIAPKLTLIKVVNNDNGGNNSEDDFPVYIGDVSAMWGENIINTGSYVVSETTLPGYVPGEWRGDCDSNGNVSLKVGESKTCTITNDDQSPTITLIKSVINDNGGKATSNDFGLTIDGNPATSGVTYDVYANKSIVINESDVYGYSFVSIQGTGCPANLGDGVTLGVGENLICTILNNDQAPKLTLNKIIVNDNGGTSVASDWLLTATGNTTISGYGTVSSGTDFVAGNYKLTETGGPLGYTASTWNCNQGLDPLADDSVLLNVGDEVVCEITNNDETARLVVKKVLINDNGGILEHQDFSFNLDSKTYNFESDGQNEYSLNAGKYSVVENMVAGYSTTYDNCNDITLSNGQTEVCTIINNDDVPSLTLIKKLDINYNGSATTNDWILTASGPSDISGAGYATSDKNFLAGRYVLSESGSPMGYEAGMWICNDNVITDNEISIELGDTVNCEITNKDLPGTLIVKKIVINDNGGTLNPHDFQFSYNGSDYINFESDAQNEITVSAGNYEITEKATFGYSTSYDNCSNLKINNGDKVVCTITNDDISPIVKVYKEISGDQYGDLSKESDFILNISAINPSISKFSGDSNGTEVKINVGEYNVYEDFRTGYSAVYSEECRGSIKIGEVKVCTVTNTAVQPKLTIYKKVIGGIYTVSDFPLYVDTFPVVSGITNGFNIGRYLVSEDNKPGYTPYYSGDCDSNGYVEVLLGDDKSCTITNTRDTAKITVIKDVVPDDDSLWDIKIMGETIDDFVLNDGGSTGEVTLNTGSYVVSESPYEGTNGEYYNSYFYCYSNVVDGQRDLISSPVYTEGRTINIDLVKGADLTCEFRNEIIKSDIHGYKWEDINQNGVRDYCDNKESEDCAQEKLLAGWTIFIDSNNNGVLDNGEKSTTTSSEINEYGWYWFEDLIPGEYKICEVMKMGWTQTYPISPSCHLVNLPYSNQSDYAISTNFVYGPEMNFGNYYNPPRLTISKYNNVNDGEIVSKRGGTVNYTIVVKAFDNTVYDVFVYDLPPQGFKYKSGSWKADSNIRGNLKLLASTNIEPVYSSPGTWYLDDIVPGEIVTLSYTAEIDTNQEPGTQKDLAWAKGIDQNETPLLAESEEQGYITENFVGTMAVLKVENDSPSEDVEVDEEVIKEGRVLGASTLPSTGTNSIWLLLALTLLSLGTVILSVGSMPHKGCVNSKTNRLKRMKSILAMLLLFLTLGSVNAKAADGDIVIRLNEPDSPTNEKFNLNFVALDLQNNVITAQCLYTKSSANPDIVFNTVTLKAGGNSGTCTASGILNSDDTYYFKVRASSSSGVSESNTVKVVYDNDGPDKPKSLDVEKKDDCRYEIKFKTADDNQTSYVEVYRSEDKEFTIDEDTRIKIINIGPNERDDFIDTLNGSECKEGDYYYAIRAFDSSGNASDFRVQELTTIRYEDSEETQRDEEEQGAIPVEGVSTGVGIGTEGAVNNDEETIPGGILGSEGEMSDSDADLSRNR
jgi:hypothetical protein